MRKFIVIYFDNILIYNKHDSEHLNHLHQVLKILQTKKLYINLKKCTFLTKNMIFLGFIVGAEGIRVDEKNM